MTTTVEAIYENGVLKPPAPISLPEHARVQLTIQPSPVVASEFARLAKQWRRETGLLSIAKQKAVHPAYQKIIGMGRDAVPLILKELEERGGDWIWALEMIVRDENPAVGLTNFREAADAWLKWGRANGLVG